MKSEGCDQIFFFPSEERTLGRRPGLECGGGRGVEMGAGLRVESGSTVWVSREVLACSSPVFKRMLYGAFAEAGRNEVPLPGKEPADVLLLARLTHPHPHVDRVTGNAAIPFLPFSDFCGMAEWSRF